MKKRIIAIISLCLCFAVILFGCSFITVGSSIPEEFYQQAQQLGVDYVRYGGYLIHNLGLGFVEVLKDEASIVGTRVGIFPTRLVTHLTMLSLHEGMTTPEVVAVCGMPEGAVGSGFFRLCYKTVDGYLYWITFHNSTNDDPFAFVVESYSIESPQGTRWVGEEAVMFQQKTSFVYLGIAAILGVVLVVLIKVPNAIRKRKAASQPE